MVRTIDKHDPPSHMRRPRVPASGNVELSFGPSSQEWFWSWYTPILDRITLYEEGDLFCNGVRRIAPDPTKSRAEMYEQTCAWIEALYALGEEDSLFTGENNG